MSGEIQKLLPLFARYAAKVPLVGDEGEGHSPSPTPSSRRRKKGDLFGETPKVLSQAKGRGYDSPTSHAPSSRRRSPSSRTREYTSCFASLSGRSPARARPQDQQTAESRLR